MHKIDSCLSIEQAWDVSQESREAFDEHVAYYEIDYAQWSPDSPFWAYWVARFVIMDHWPIGEELIASDARVQDSYKRYIAVLKNVRILGHTTGQEPVRKTKQAAQPTTRHTIRDLDEHAARIAKTIQQIKQTKRSDDPDDSDQWDIQSAGDN